MASPFEDVTKVALKEIIESHLQMSKFGYFLSEEDFSHLTEDLFLFLQTSRRIKAAGDRAIAGGQSPKQFEKLR
jgi:hypothetical protein